MNLAFRLTAFWGFDVWSLQANVIRRQHHLGAIAHPAGIHIKVSG